MTSQRKRKKQAQARGLTTAELELVELLEEVLDSLRWMQILAFSNQYLMNEKLEVTQEERDKILEAATRAVDKDARLHEWKKRLGRLKGQVQGIDRNLEEARSELEDGKAEEAGSDA